MHIDTHTGLEAPQGVWWKPAHKSEKVWIGIAFAWCMVLFAMMPLWHWKGGQNPSGIRTRTNRDAYMNRVVEFISQYQVGSDKGMPIVAPPPGSDVYLAAMAFQWMPILKLQKDVQYTLHLSALDVNHGFSLFPININFQVVPGYDYGLRVTPNVGGDFRILCNEFCGIGHHLMVGRVIVDDTRVAMADGERAIASEPRERSGDSGGPASERERGSAGAKPPGLNGGAR